MRSFNPRYTHASKESSITPLYTIALHFERDDSDVVYLTSHSSAGRPAGANVIDGCITRLSGATQKIDPKSAASSIGGVTFEVVDIDGQISSLLAQKNAEGKSLREKKCVVYYGYDRRVVSVTDDEGNPSPGYIDEIDWLDYEKHFTMLVSDYAHSPGAYSFKLDDVQRLEKKELFVLDKSTLRESITSDQLLIPIAENALTNKFQLIEHDQSYSHRPGETVGYVRIRDEVICHAGVVNDVDLGVALQVVERGALNTLAVGHEVDENVTDDRKTKVEEFVYLEGPTLKILYAVQTGILYGQGKTLPDHWHQGVPESFIRVSDYTEADPSLWEPTANTGRKCRFEGLKKQNGESFIREQVLMWLGGIRPVYSDGAIGFKKLATVLPGSDHVFELNNDNVVRFGSLSHRLNDVVNSITVNWDWSFLREQYVQTTQVVDLQSIDKYGAGEPRSVSFLGVKSSNQTDQDLRNVFNGYRSRFGGGGFTLTAELLPLVNNLEVGDLVLVETDVLLDPLTGSPLSRVFEVQQISPNTSTGRARLSLFASTEQAGEFELITESTVLNDGFYTSDGINIATVATMSGNTIVNDVTLDGGDTLGEGIFYYLGDLILDSNATMYISGNVQLRVMGTFTRNGDVIGVGAGHPGGSGGTDFLLNGQDVLNLEMSPPPTSGSDIEPDRFFQDVIRLREDDLRTNEGAGVSGYMGVSRPANYGLMSGFRSSNNGELTSRSTQAQPNGWIRAYDSDVTVTGQNVDAPRLSVVNREGDSLEGFSGLDLRGTSGPGSRPLFQGFDHFAFVESIYGLFEIVQDGAKGGDSGAGLVVICRGESVGASSVVDLSGEDGEAPPVFRAYNSSSGQFYDRFYNGGGGGGAPGAYYLLIDGNSTFGTSTANVRQFRGLAGAGGTRLVERVPYSEEVNYYDYYDVKTVVDGEDLGPPSLGRSLDLPVDFGALGFKVQYLPPPEGLGEGPDTPGGEGQEVQKYQLSAVVGLSLATGTAQLRVSGDGTIQERVRVDVEAPTDSNATRIEVQAKESAEPDSEYRTVANIDATSPIAFFDVTEGVAYSVRVRHDGDRGIVFPSEWAFSAITAQGKSLAPADPIIISLKVDAALGVLLALSAHPDPDFLEYIVSLDGDELAKASATTFSLGFPSAGSRSYSVIARDRTRNESGAVGYVLDVEPPGDPVVVAEFASDGLVLSWSDSAATLPIVSYTVLREGLVYSQQNATSILIPVDWVGTRTFGIVAIDAGGNASSEVQVVVQPTVPNAPDVAIEYSGGSVLMTWPDASTDLKVSRYFVKYSGSVIAEVSQAAWQGAVNWVGSRTFQVVAIDSAGNVGDEAHVIVNPTPPSAPSFTSDVIDNNVLFKYSSSAGSLPIESYELKKGPVFDEAEDFAIKAGTSSFTTLFENSAGTYTYWVLARDTAGNLSPPTSNTATVSQPPDFVLFATYSLRQMGWLGTKTNAVVSGKNTLLAPVDASETWADYLANGYDTFQSEINASFLAWPTPAPSTAKYEEVVDYGVVLSGSLITASLTPDAISGSVVTSVLLSYSSDGVTWVDGEANQRQIFGIQFRYIRIAVDFIADGNDLVEMEDIQIKLDRKLRSDAGRANAVAADSAGTSVLFNASFVDIVSINVTPRGSSAVQAVYDFVDAPNPTEMFVYLFDSSGNRVSGEFSWSVEGY